MVESVDTTDLKSVDLGRASSSLAVGTIFLIFFKSYKMTGFYHFFLAIPVYGLYGLFKLLPIDVASWLGGFLFRCLGPLLPVNRRALHNIKRIMPKKTEEFYRLTLKAMWKNLGCNFGEFPHLKKIIKDPKRLQLKNFSYTHVLEKGKAGFFLGAHYGNWEISAPTIVQKTNLSLHLIYRVINNVYIERLISKSRKKNEGHVHFYPKGPGGARACIKALKNKEVVGMLLDQKLNDGISVPFMGEKAMTAPALAQFALKFKGPVVPVRCIRVKGAHFILEFFPPIEVDKQIKSPTVEELTEQFNNILGKWVYEYPEQWFWVHSRWPFSKKMS